MKKTITLIVLFVGIISVKSQIAIGKESTTNTSVSLEFGDENRGLILPYVENKAGITEEGSIIYDATDHKVKYLKNDGWFDLSIDETGVAVLDIQTTKTEQPTAKVVIGADGETNTTNGILVLSDQNKAMILPKVASPHEKIIDPAAGMVVYDTVAKQLAVYNGTVWSFWKPE